MANSVLDKIKALDAERASLLGQAHKEALEKAESAVEELNSLGFNYCLTNLDEKRSSGERKTRKVSDGPCPICEFKTSPYHDARKHRSQTTKKPFTAAELEEHGLTKVD